jgi:hypothetical protein
MNTALNFILLCFLTFSLGAQNKSQDRIQLMNGTVKEGTIIEQIPGQSILLQQATPKDTLRIFYDQILKITKIIPEQNELGTVNKSVKKENAFGPPFNTRPAYVMIHGLVGGGDYPFTGFGMSMGWNIDPWWQLGGGVNYLGQVDGPQKPHRQIVPVYGEMRYGITWSKNGRFTTFLQFGGGYNFTLNGEYFDEATNLEMKYGRGWYINPAIAFRVNISKHTGLMFDVGYQMNTAPIIQVNNDQVNGTKQWNLLQIRGSFFF